MGKKNKNEEIQTEENEVENEEIKTEVIVPAKIDKITEMKRDIQKLERLTKSISLAKKTALSANAKLERLLQYKKDLESKYNL
ncbi:MAG: hypothetical protein U9Q27_03570 [Patescibacteria group bacterium]|nr:hypothetical protein [Patescibacteria group bacterium]